MEIDRLNYLLNDYARTRLKKINKFAIHISKTSSEYVKLSKPEQGYLIKYNIPHYPRHCCTFIIVFAYSYITLVQQHYDDTVLSKIPEAHRYMGIAPDPEAEREKKASQRIKPEPLNMVDAPSLDTHVAVRVKRYLERVHLGGDNQDNAMELRVGDILFVHYGTFKGMHPLIVTTA
jgi:hypothetical protein